MHEIDVFVKWIFQHEKILLVEVGLGNIETVSKQDKTRKSPSSLEFDSIIVSQNPFCGKIYCFLWFFCQAKELTIKFYHPNKWKYQNIGNHFKCVNNSFLLFFFLLTFLTPLWLLSRTSISDFSHWFLSDTRSSSYFTGSGWYGLQWGIYRL